MSMPTVHLAFLWHQHQPNYRDLRTGRSALPWVRLHGVKDYYGMARLLLEAAENGAPVRATINLVPTMLAQLQAYAAGSATDPHLELSSRPAADLNADERASALDLFFEANRPNVIEAHPRYAELLAKRRLDEVKAEDVADQFSDEDIRDLQVWANLAWFHHTIIERDEHLRDLIQKDRSFSEDDQAFVLARQREVLGEVIGLHRRLQDDGIIEISTSPFYHPILPLLCNMEDARVALPDTPLPVGWTPLVEDAREQLARAVAQYETLFGRRPTGLWPSEGSVSPAMLPLVAEQGFRWLATDEQILARSIVENFDRDNGNENEDESTTEDPMVAAEKLYQPYQARTPHGELALVFRDRQLSDLIGFEYQRWDSHHAVQDFLGRLRSIGRRVESPSALVPVILDGENCWEHYPGGGVPFLRELYRELSRSDDIRTVRIGEHLIEHPPGKTIKRLFSGSWINHNFYIWIGHEEDLCAWEYLLRVRQDLQRFAAELADANDEAQARLRQAWESLYAAEGSDWFWWYGEDHTSDQGPIFDELFRTHLKNVYHFMGRSQPPPFLNIPVTDSKPGNGPD